ncbi:VC0807 family protein [Streptomyces sp. Pv4-95]|uniref:VC0807 family protein n=1 Tax=Streptomyces sp. Pv4-95 TaxID=3049543 RepID=UPI003891C405
MEPSRTHRLGRLARMTRLALDLGISSLAYYGCALAGIDTLPALLTAAGVAAAWLATTTLYDRRADGLALGMLLMYALSAAFAAATSEPRLLLLRDPLVSALAGLVFLGSCLGGTPATAYLARRLHGHPLRDPQLRRAHRTQTLVLGTGLTAEALARVLLGCALPVTTAAAITPPLEFVVLIPLVVWTIRQRRKVVARSSAPAAGSVSGVDAPTLPHRSGVAAPEQARGGAR